MFSSAFFDSLVGGFTAVFMLLAGVLIWDYFERHKQNTVVTSPKSSYFDTIPERELERYLVQNFSSLFPDFSIYNDEPKNDRPTGIQLNTKEAGIIDILALDTENNFVILELKKAKAPDRVVAQVDRYIEWVERHLAHPAQGVRAVVIALDSRLLYTLARREQISATSFAWEIGLSLTEKSLPNRVAELTA